VRLQPQVERVPDGAGSGPWPGSLPDLTGRCADEAVCEVTIAAGALLVGGRKAGTTEVVLSFTNPVRGGREEARVAVSFAEARPVPLEVGSPLANAALLRGAPGEGGPVVDHMCFPAAVPPPDERALDVGDIVRGFAEERTCLPAVELAPGRSYFPFAPFAPGRDAPLVACLHHSMRGEVLVSMSLYRTPKGQPPALVEHRGPPDEVCAVKAKAP
jgi:hypothetical protein